MTDEERRSELADIPHAVLRHLVSVVRTFRSLLYVPKNSTTRPRSGCPVPAPDFCGTTSCLTAALPAARCLCGTLTCFLMRRHLYFSLLYRTDFGLQYYSKDLTVNWASVFTRALSQQNNLFPGWKKKKHTHNNTMHKISQYSLIGTGTATELKPFFTEQW